MRRVHAAPAGGDPNAVAAGHGPSGIEWVRRTRRWLVVIEGARLLAWAGAATLVALAVGYLLNSRMPEPEFARVLAGMAGCITLIVLAWPERRLRSDTRVAMWLEEQAPELRYALVTSVDPACRAVRPVLPAIDLRGVLRRSARRRIVPALVGLCAGLIASGAAPRIAALDAVGRLSAPVVSPGDERSRLEPLGVTVVPPDYAGLAGMSPVEMEDPATVQGLAGSRVQITGPGPAQGIHARIGTTALPVRDSEAMWSVSFELPDSAQALRLEHGTHSRLVVLDSKADHAPLAQLLLPARDTTVRVTHPAIQLHARLADDIGVQRAWFEYIISSGESEGSFRFQEGTLGLKTFDGGDARDGELRLTVPLASFGLQPGEQLSLRAVVRDNNTWNGPGTGYSATRTLRVARPSEYDSLAVEGAPPAVDSTLLTLRYLIQLTEGVSEQREVMERAVFVDTSLALGRRTERLRDRVQVLQADRTVGGLFDRDPYLDSAYLALAEGAGTLLVAEPGAALPHLWEAFNILRRYAISVRYHLRGRSPEILVDLARVRLTGSDTGQATPRTPREVQDTALARRLRVYTAAVAAIDRDRGSAIEQLLTLQVEALRRQPALATALGSAAAAVREGRDASAELERVRRMLQGTVTTVDTLPRWSGGW